MRPLAHIVILTGAGISAESGLPTFRGVGGLWEGHRIEEVATPEAFATNPALVHRFYNLRRATLDSVKPNAAHVAIARLQREWRGRVTLITQNVDDLHERGGSTDVLHMHGELRKVRCIRCGMVDLWQGDLTGPTPCPSCNETGTLRPHIVWFGEMPMHLDEIDEALHAATLFVAIGTSGHVYPAADFVRTAKRHSAHTIEINVAPTETSRLFDERRQGPATERVPEWVEALLADATPR